MSSSADLPVPDEISPARITMPKPRADAVERPALDAELELAFARTRLVLLCAPAGYGKTTALVQQLSRSAPGRAHVWVSVSEDDDLPSLLACLLAALDPLDLPWRRSPQEWPSLVLQPGGPATVVAALRQALEHAELDHGVIALDDLHRLADPSAYAFLDMLVGRLPARWTLAVASRRRPPLALERLRLQGDVAEFGEAQLRFGRQELRQLLSRHAPQADDGSVEQLYRATQGWPVGAATLGHSLKLVGASQGVRDRRRRLFDYLATEVLDELPLPMRSFLLRCSVLRELDAERCRHVSGDARAAQWLEELQRRDLFVSVLETELLTLRLHDLFREFLEARLLMEHPDEHAQLLLRAAEGEPDFVRRVGLRLRASAADRALADVMDHAANIVLSGGDEQLLHVVGQFPVELRSAPELAFARGVCAWNRFRWQTMVHAMLEAAAGFERKGQAALAVQARAFASLALNCVGRVEEARRLWQGAPSCADGGAPRMACALADYVTSLMNGPGGVSAPLMWQVVQAIKSSADLPWLCFQAPCLVLGRWGLRAPTEAMTRVLAVAADDEHPRLKTTVMLLEAWLALWRADLAKLRALREPLERESAWLGDPLTLMSPLQYMLAFEKHITGDAEAARALMRGLRDAARIDPERRCWIVYSHVDAAFASANGEWSVAERLRAQLDVSDPSWPFLPFALAALDAEIALQHGQAQAAAQGLRPLLEQVADVDHWATHTRVRLALGRAELQLGDPCAAWQVLQPALDEVRVSGETLAFLLVGPAALDELAAAQWPASAEPALIALLRQMAANAHRLRDVPAQAAPAFTAPILSEREWQVLRLIVEGRSNKLIARALDLSPHTVKRHVARILERTGQASRAAAAEWCMRHGG